MKTKTQKLMLDSCGFYLGMEKGCFVVKDKQKKVVQKYPLFESDIGEVVLKGGNYVSTGALASMGFWNIDCLITTQKGNPVAMLKSLDDDSHVKTRICQYGALKDGRAFEIAKSFILGKIEGQNRVLQKYGLKRFDYSVFEAVKNLKEENFRAFRRRLNGIEGKCSEKYFNQIFQLFEEALRPPRRRTFKAYDGVNNLFNLAYEMLSWKVHRALIKAKLEPYLGFAHSLQYGKPSLVCDFMELYRFLIDDFIIQQCRKYTKKDFTHKRERFSSKKIGKRQYLDNSGTKKFMKRLDLYFEKKVEVPRIRVGERQTLETLINEEALLFAKYLRHERETWKPRIAMSCGSQHRLAKQKA